MCLQTRNVAAQKQTARPHQKDDRSSTVKAAYYGRYLRFLLGGIKPLAAIVIIIAAKEEVWQSLRSWSRVGESCVEQAHNFH